MYQRILLAYDGSDHAAAALRQSAELARLCEAKLYLLGIVVMPGAYPVADGFGAIGTNIWGMEEEFIQQALDEAVHDLSRDSVTVVGTIRRGNPAYEIITYAQEINADLVVFGHSEKGILARWLQGSVGVELLKDQPCSLLIAVDKA